MEKITWLTLGEVANLLGIGLRAVQKNCAAEKYLTRKVKSGKGGGNGGEVYEIALSSLPIPAQKKYALEIQATATAAAEMGTADALKAQLEKDMEAKTHQITANEGNRAYIMMKGAAKTRADAKLDILEALERYIKATGEKPAKAIPHFATDYNRGSIEGLTESRDLFPEISVPSLYRWKTAIKTAGAAALAGKYGHRKGSGLIDTQPAVKEYILATLANQSHTSIRNLHKGLCARFAGRADITLPACRSLERWVADWKEINAELHTALANPDAWKNQFMVAFGSASAGIERLNQLWELDSTPADVMLTDGRHSIIGVIDVYSRRLKLLVAKTSKAVSVTLLIRRAILEWGVPEGVKTDNGADYVSRHVTRALRFLGIEQSLCQPFQPWQKPHIERALGSFSHGPVEMMEGYIGHNVADRAALRAKQSFADRLMTKNEVIEIKLDSHALQALCDQWTDTVYALEGHEGLGGKSPAAMVREWNQPIKRITDPRALDLLLAEAPGDGYRTVGKAGLRIDNDLYIAPELALYARKRVHVLYDPEDLGKVYVYSDEGGATQFVCIAECPDRTGINRQEVAAKAREIQKKNVQEGRKQLRELSKKVKVEDALSEILAAAEKADNVIRLRPHDTEEHTTAALDAAAEAAKVAGLDDGAKTVAEIIEIKSRNDAVIASKATIEEPDFPSEYQRAFWLWEKAIRGETISEGQEDFLRRWRLANTRSWRSLNDLLNDKWGERYLAIRDIRLGLKA